MEDNELVIKEIKRILDKIRPYLNSEGGDLEFIDFKDGIKKLLHWIQEK